MPPHPTPPLSSDTLTTLIVQLDDQGQVQWVNAALENALACTIKRLQRLPIADWFVTAKPWHEALWRIQHQQASVVRFEASLLHPTTEPLPILAALSCSEPSILCLEMWPLSQLAKQWREQRQQEHSQLHQELIRNLAHEIKNPLGGLRGAAQLLEMELPDSNLQEYTQIIIHEADRLQNLVQKLLAPHRQTLHGTYFNLHAVCERARTLVLAQHPMGLVVRRDYDVSIPDWWGDEQALIQVLVNLVHNAAWALTPKIQQGTALLAIKTRIAHQITFNGHRHALAVQIQIIDNGPGVPLAVQERLFSPLSRAASVRQTPTPRPNGQGLGLGLTIAQALVSQHKGFIDCHSQPGHTVFTVTLPQDTLPYS